MSCWIVIPIKEPAACKTRLAPVLDEAGRRELVAGMLRRTFAAASEAGGKVLLLGPSRHGLPEDIPLLADAGLGLNPALEGAKREALLERVDRLILLSADLPLVTAQDVAALAALPPDALGAAPDRAGLGTNALSLPLPAAADFRFHYGEGSFAAHRQEAERHSLPFLPIVRPGLQFDIDEAADLTASAHPG